MTTIATDNRLERLTELRADGRYVVSCYLKLEPRDRARGKYLIKLKNRIRAVEQSLPRLGLDRAERESVVRDLRRIVEYFQNPGQLPGTQGMAVFASDAANLFEVIPLPLVHRSRLGVDHTPLVRELASVEDEFGHLLTAVTDRTAARFFEVTAFGVEELAGLHAPNTRGGRFHGDRQGGPSGWGEHTYHNRIREEKQRHYAAVAHQLFELDRRRAVRGFVLAGSGTDSGAVKPFLHAYIAERLMGTAKLNPKDVTVAMARAATLAVREDYERASERAAVEQMEEGLGTGWALRGVPATLRGLARGQVRTLLVDADSSAPGFRCSDSGRLALNESDCRGEGEAVPVLDVIDEAIEEALRQRVAVEVVYDRGARASLDGLGALLRFR